MRLGEYPPASPPVQDGVWQDHAPPARKAAESDQVSGEDPELIALAALDISKPLRSMRAERARQKGRHHRMRIASQGPDQGRRLLRIETPWDAAAL